MSGSGALAIATVLAHCGGDPGQAVRYLAGAIADNPADTEPYGLLVELRDETARVAAVPNSLWQLVVRAHLHYLDGESDQAAQALGAVIGHRPDIAWATAPWFSTEQFREKLSAPGFADACLNITDQGRPASDHLEPWFRAIDAVCDREPNPEAMARMAILLRASGRIDESLALCDRADSVEPVVLTQVVRAGTWRSLGNNTKAADAFRGALELEPDNWSLYLDLADLAAESGDYAEAAALTRQAREHEPNDVTLRAADAVYHARVANSPVDEKLLDQVPNAAYRKKLIGHVSP